MTNKEKINELALAAMKGGIGAIPGFGPLLTEIVNVAIPNQRLKRIEKLLLILAAKQIDLETPEIQAKFEDPEFLDIFEDTLHQTVKTVSNERIEYLASVLEKGLSKDDFKHLQVKRLLEILSDLNDAEILLLKSYGTPFTNQKISGDRNTEIIDEEAETQHRAMIQNYQSRLIMLGLIGPFSANTRHGSSSLYPTKLGSMLLDEIGLHEENRFTSGEPIDAHMAFNNMLSSLDEKEKDIRKEIEKDAKTAQDSIKKELRNLESQLRNSGRVISSRTTYFR